MAINGIHLVSPEDAYRYQEDAYQGLVPPCHSNRSSCGWYCHAEMDKLQMNPACLQVLQEHAYEYTYA